MALSQFVTRRGERLYYRRAFPQDLWHITGRSPFAVSLRTSDPQEALRARPAAERLYDRKVDEARAELARQGTLRPLTEADAVRLALDWFREAVEAWAPQPRDAEELIQARDLESLMEIEAREALALNRDNERTFLRRNHIPALAERIRDATGLASNPEGEAALQRLLRRAEVAQHQVRAARLMGDYGTRPDDPLFASALDAPQGAPAAQPIVTPQAASRETVADLETAFKAARLSNLSPASEAAYAPVFRLLREAIGADRPLASLTHDDGQALFDTIRAIPTNAQKVAALRGLPLAEQIEEARRLGLPTLSAKTINDRYLAGLGALFRFARQRGWMNLNPVEGFRAREEVAPADRREPFGEARLKEGAEMTPSDIATKALWQARDCMAADLKGGCVDLRYHIDVHDESGAKVHSIAFADAVQIVSAD